MTFLETQHQLIMQIYSPILYPYQSSTFHVHERYQLQGSSEVSMTYQWSILTFFVQYQTTVNWSLNDCQLTIKRLSRDYQLIWPLPYQPLYWPYTTYNKHDPVLKRQILSFFTSLIIYGCKNFSTLICWNTSRYLKRWRKLKLSAES